MPSSSRLKAEQLRPRRKRDRKDSFRFASAIRVAGSRRRNSRKSLKGSTVANQCRWRIEERDSALQSRKTWSNCITGEFGWKTHPAKAAGSCLLSRSRILPSLFRALGEKFLTYPPQSLYYVFG